MTRVGSQRHRKKKQPGRDVDHTPLSSAEVKNEWSYTSSPLICHHGVEWDNFAFTYVSQTCVISAAGKASDDYGNPRDFLTK